MYVVYCQNKPMSEYIVSEHIDTYFEVRFMFLPQQHSIITILPNVNAVENYSKTKG